MSFIKLKYSLKDKPSIIFQNSVSTWLIERRKTRYRKSTTKNWKGTRKF